MQISTSAPRGRTRWYRLSVVLAVLLILTGCGVRLDVPPAPTPVPEGQDEVRQEAAQAVSVILQSAELAIPDAPEQVGGVLQAVAADAQAHLEALGGVWEPPPRPEPEDPEDAPPAQPEPITAAGASDVLAALEAAAPQLRGGAASVEPDLAVLLVSVSANQHVHARDLAGALGADPAPPPAEPADPADAYPAAFGPEAAPLCRALDAAGYLAEVRAGRASGEEAARLAERAQELRAQAELVATRGGFSGTEEDPREIAYALAFEDLPAQAQALALTRVPAWLNLLESAEEGADRELIAIQVITAALAVHGRGEPVPTFPGRAG
ncbi:hypothetical protein [Pseudactinotalea sp. Z1732]|uniref:hypothetical protein n=1 Tax=Micrococcales TaxID=85006 RepID=UPI003C7B5851